MIFLHMTQGLRTLSNFTNVHGFCRFHMSKNDPRYKDWHTDYMKKLKEERQQKKKDTKKKAPVTEQE